MASMISARQLRLPGGARAVQGRGLMPQLVRSRYRCLTVHSAKRAPEAGEKQSVARDADTQAASTARTGLLALSGAVTGLMGLSAFVGPVVAAVDESDQVIGPATDVLLGNGGGDISITSLLLCTLLAYWFFKSVAYLLVNPLDEPEKDAKDPKDANSKQQPGGSSFNDMGHAHIRSYVDSSRPGPGSLLDARDLRNASLARSAAYRVTATTRESLPRIHALVEELAGSGPEAQWPLRRPQHADVDFVAALVYDRVVQERQAKGPDAGELTPRERAALETRLLEEVAERCAVEQVRDLVTLAAQGKLHPRQSGGDGAGHPPPSHAH